MSSRSLEALQGCVLGENGGPPEWVLARLTDRGEWGRDALLALARDAHAVR